MMQPNTTVQSSAQISEKSSQGFLPHLAASNHVMQANEPYSDIGDQIQVALNH